MDHTPERSAKTGKIQYGFSHIQYAWRHSLSYSLGAEQIAIHLIPMQPVDYRSNGCLQDYNPAAARPSLSHRIERAILPNCRLRSPLYSI